jgi:N-acetylgalactosamine-6-sulfatase
MQRRAFLQTLGAGGLGLAAGRRAGRSAEAPRRPNVLFILADDLGWGDLSCYGQPRLRTPALDRLAREGTLFTQYYQGGSVCSPSRACLLTGRWPAEFRIHGHYATAEQNTQRDMSQCLDPQAATLPKLLRAGGYYTAHVGKWHLGLPAGTPRDAAALRCYGFDEARWLDAQGEIEGKVESLWGVPNRPRATKVLVDETITVLERARNQPQPFYCELWLNDPHAPLAPSAEQRKPYRGGTPDGFTSPFEVYAGTVAEMDRQLGRLLAKLDELGLARDTIVVFSSDNGPEDIEIGNASWSGVGSAGPLRGRKRSLYEGGVRVPFLVRWPAALPAGGVNDQTVVSGADLLPTLCELAGVSLSAEVQATQRGQSVAAALRGDHGLRRARPLFWEWRFRVFNHPWNRSPILAVRDGQWKLLLNPDRSRVELYDIPADPAEQYNQAAQQPAVVERLSALALAWQQTLPPGKVEPAAGRNDYTWPKAGGADTPEIKQRTAWFEQKDTNRDGFLSLEEYLHNFPDEAEGRRRFPTFDTNKDGRLSRDEFIHMGR